MSRKLVVGMLLALGALAATSTFAPELWWVRLFGRNQAVGEPLWKLSLLGDGVELDARLGGPSIVPGRDTVIPLRLALQGQASMAPRQRLPLNVALVVDRSGSMEEDSRMQQVKRTVDLLIGSLHPEDSVAVVSFGTGVTVHRQAGEKFDPQILREQVASMTPGGGTNLFGGLEEGCRQVEGQLRPGINRILLFSDGIANIGLRDPRQIVERLAPCLDRGITITTIGVGADFNEDLLAELAERGRGNYYFVERSEEMSGALAHELEELGSVVAQEPTLRLDLPEGVELSTLYGYEHASERGAVLIPMKDLYAGEQRKILVELRVRGISASVTAVVKPSLSWRATDQSSKSLAADRPLSVTSAKDDAEQQALQDPEVAAEVLYTRNSTAVEEASRLVASGRNTEAEQQIERVLERTRSEGARYKQAKVTAQVGDLERSLEWVRGANAEPQQKVTAKRMKAEARLYAKQ
jgi:Ca-activated chloride channel homolog